MDIEILNEERLRYWSGLIDVQPGAVDALAQIAQRVCAEESLRAVFYAFYEQRVLSSPLDQIWPDVVFDLAVESAMGSQTSLFYLLAYLAALPRLAHDYQRRGISMQILHDTLLDVRIWLGQGYDVHGEWRMNELDWIRLHLAGRLYRLGRLQFMLAEFEGSVRAFRRRAGGEVILLGDPDDSLRADGYALGAGRKRGAPLPPPDQHCWQAVYQESTAGWQGNPVHALGYTLRQPVTLPRAEWELILQHGDTVMDLHIPRGERMCVEDCRDSFRQAFAFFAQHAPERPFKACFCHTWFFTPQLQKILPAESNLVRFQREFSLFPYAGGPAFLWDYVFGGRYPDPAAAPRDTTLRRATLDWLDQGGEFFDLPGLMFHGPEEWGSQPYMRWWEAGGVEQWQSG
jgi:hypothetical protein